jgi:hypothetical protein
MNAGAQAAFICHPTFVVYKDGQKASTVTLRGDVESFTQDFNYRYLKPQ